MPRRKAIGWKRLDHVSVVVEDADKWLAFYRKLFGLDGKEHAWFDDKKEGFRGTAVDLPNTDVQLEVMEPNHDGSFLKRFLAERGGGVHHTTVEVEDIEAAAAYLKNEMGIEPFRGIWSDGVWRQTFIHPRDTGGVLIQLFEPEKKKAK
jgi:methylmalonyl-CoA/ethylmalonyl-CoA epimerase